MNSPDSSDSPESLNSPESLDSLDSPENPVQENARESGGLPNTAMADELWEENRRLRMESMVIKAQLMVAEAKLDASNAAHSGKALEPPVGIAEKTDEEDLAKRIAKYEQTIASLEAEKKKILTQWTRSANMLIDAVKRAQKAEEELAALREQRGKQNK